ncbi:MAG: hypothetical protein E7214_09835 [Clostridium sp.]|nr:hypothetical protein [Clostridium sp.]
MELRVETILDYLDIKGVDYKYLGNKNLVINKFSAIDSISHNTISYVTAKEDLSDKLIKDASDFLLVISDSINVINISNRVNFISCKDPKKCFFSILEEFFKSQERNLGIGKNSVIKSKEISNNVSIGCNCYIGDKVIIKEGVIIKNNVSLEGKVYIGKNTIISSGCIVGVESIDSCDGKALSKESQYGGVYIGNNVEIGANTVINRGTIEDTLISDGSKIGSLCYIGKDVVIDENTSIKSGKVIL